MKIDEQLSKQLRETSAPGRELAVIIELEPGADVAMLRSAGVKVNRVYENISAVAATITADLVPRVAALPQVKRIELDTEARVLGPR